MSIKRTSKQIEAEIRALDECRKFIPRYTKFREDNFAVLNAGISALADRLSVDMAYDMSGDVEPSREDQARIDAAQWLEGETDETPSSGWQMYRKELP